MGDDAAITLDDKFKLGGGVALVAGRQVLVRLPIVQREVDRRAGLKTAGYISGYRGSPLGGYDAELWKAAEVLEEHDIVFEPGLNEDLALTAIAGTQQLDFLPGRTVDGVFGLWYGKGPGVDRSGDAIKHANLQGTSPLGGVVLIVGDDHAGKSSTTAHQSDLTLASWGVPVLYPSSVDEILSLGLAAIAMSRFSGALVALKLVNETAEATGVLDLATPRELVIPDQPEPPGGVHIRPEVLAMQAQETRLMQQKLPRAMAFARANRLDRVTFGCAEPRFLIATSGKAYADVLAALSLLGLDEAAAIRLGVGVYKISLLFPLEPEGLEAAARSAKEIFFVEEKRPHAESQARLQLFDRAVRPRITGKTSPGGEPLLPADAPLNGSIVAAALAKRLLAAYPDIGDLAPDFMDSSALVEERLASSSNRSPLAVRRPAFCPGCPHNTSTKVPQGSIGGTGIGCHGMVVFHPERNPIPMGHMGAEGANWIGLSRFTTTSHIFQNLGDGTYNHSGSLAIRAAVQAKTNITYKILFNDAVAMTGGQPVEGQLTVARIVSQVRAEGVARVVVLSEDPARFKTEPLPAGTELRHRDDLAAVQEVLRGELGVSVLIYDQVCAAEKRRRRKVGLLADPARRMFINPLVCEGCGDCSTQSNCLAVQPLETELGRKRRIDQSACNKDFSCLNGFCPSFVSVEGGTPRRRGASAEPVALLPLPTISPLIGQFEMVVAGIGGTGVVTVSAILAMAARIEGFGVSVFDMTGLSQKGGAVFSHFKLNRAADATFSAKVGPGQANVIIACDLVAAMATECLETISPDTVVLANTDTVATANFQLNRDHRVDPAALAAKFAETSGRSASVIAATSLAEQLFGDSIGANMLMLGYVWQRGVLPLSLNSIERAIILNGKSSAANRKAFEAGRRAALREPLPDPELQTLDAFISGRANDLRGYWNASYARRYTDLVDRARKASEPLADGDKFVWAVARSAYKLMAYKDEYEVARLYTDGRFSATLQREFENVKSIKLHLAPPLFARRDPVTGQPRKIAVGQWVLPIFHGLASLRQLRESPFDPFARTPERKLERALRDAFLKRVERLLPQLSAMTLSVSVEIAAAPMDVRGFGHVKADAADALLARLVR
jgi:indolepyruvate ferredoxin oxidoreductase